MSVSRGGKTDSNWQQVWARPGASVCPQGSEHSLCFADCAVGVDDVMWPHQQADDKEGHAHHRRDDSGSNTALDACHQVEGLRMHAHAWHAWQSRSMSCMTHCNTIAAAGYHPAAMRVARLTCAAQQVKQAQQQPSGIWCCATRRDEGGLGRVHSGSGTGALVAASTHVCASALGACPTGMPTCCCSPPGFSMTTA